MASRTERPRLREKYHREILPALQERFQRKNRWAVPRLSRIVLNMGVGEATENIKLLDQAAQELGLIAGQRPSIRRAKKSIASFKVRAGQPVGCRVTLRGDRMYEFFDRLVATALPRVRDFRGISRGAFDGRGNYTLGIRDQTIFLEVSGAKVDRVRGLNVTFVTTGGTDEESLTLLEGLGLPFRKA
ncbi:MAG: 50S ribosomal protein L5 [Acidobacteria bacterium]|nr:50S ribosomal protein L5 [Acidobacteriota bacterium]